MCSCEAAIFHPYWSQFGLIHLGTQNDSIAADRYSDTDWPISSMDGVCVYVCEFVADQFLVSKMFCLDILCSEVVHSCMPPGMYQVKTLSALHSAGKLHTFVGGLERSRIW